MTRQPSCLPRSPLLRPEKRLPKQRWIDRAAHFLGAGLKRPFQSRLGPYKKFLPKVKARAAQLASCSDEELRCHGAELRMQLLKNGFSDEALIQVFAMVREVSGRTLGMYHFDSQLICGLALFRGSVAEMHAGEGKTLTAALPAVTAALAGIPVHVITVNDYLAERDAELMRPIYEFFGLSVGCVIHNKSLLERRPAYRCDIVYCTNKEIVFDYLKDLIILESRHNPLHLFAERLKGDASVLDRLLLRGLHFGIVDEADSVMLDEARTPLIISGQEITNREEHLVYAQAIELARELQSDLHYRLYLQERKIELTAGGDRFVEEKTQSLSPYWIGSVRRRELMNKALSALYLFEPDKQYLVRDGKIQIIDEHTGRIMEDRAWERGLHQLIEIKEGCEPSKARETLARISYQRFFKLYHHLGGMTGTAKEVRGEFWSIYDQPVVCIPTNRVSQRQFIGSRVFKGSADKWQAVLARIRQLQSASRPVLVGTHSVGASETLSDLLTEAGIDHRLLNAKQDKDEADIVADAGQQGVVTIATSMAGRGTDIKLSKEVESAGGLHVILTEFHDAGRIDRQLEGRCARQGDPGSYEMIVSMEDFLLKSWQNNRIGRLVWQVLVNNQTLQEKLGVAAMKFAQKRLERLYSKNRYELLKADEKQSEMLAFAGRHV